VHLSESVGWAAVAAAVRDVLALLVADDDADDDADDADDADDDDDLVALRWDRLSSVISF